MNEKIIFFTDFFGPNPGGIENFHIGIAKNWKESNLITICFDHHIYVDEKEWNYFNNNFGRPIYRFNVSNNSFFHQRDKLKEIIALINYIKEHHRIKHILIGNISLTTKLLFNTIKNLNIPYSVILHPFDLETISFFRLNTLKFLKNARYIFIYTNYFYELALIKGISQEQLIKIPFGLYIRWNDNKQKIRHDFKTFLNQHKNKTKILTVGPLTKKKRLERIIYTIEHLKQLKEIRNIIWFIAGSGSEYHYLNELIQQYNLQDSIKLLGFLNDRELGYLFYFSDLYYHPGGVPNDQFSGYSTTLLEAGYTSLPSVSGMGAAIEDVIQNNITGFILDYEDYEGMAYKIKELIENPKLRARMGQYAEEKIIKEFSIERSVYNISERIN